MYSPVLTKVDFVRRYRLNEFGNRSPTWGTVEELVGSEYSGLVHLRNLQAGGPTYYNQSIEDAVALWPTLRGRYYCSAMAPHHRNLIQGEAWVDRRLYLTYSTVKSLPMREALARATQRAEGIIAVALLRQYLCGNSYDWLQTLFDRYPGHVIEFSTFSTPWGTLPNFNTTFWEVRAY